jgi:hypothetical protein
MAHGTERRSLHTKLDRSQSTRPRELQRGQKASFMLGPPSCGKSCTYRFAKRGNVHPSQRAPKSRSNAHLQAPFSSCRCYKECVPTDLRMSSATGFKRTRPSTTSDEEEDFAASNYSPAKKITRSREEDVTTSASGFVADEDGKPSAAATLPSSGHEDDTASNRNAATVSRKSVAHVFAPVLASSDAVTVLKRVKELVKSSKAAATAAGSAPKTVAGGCTLWKLVLIDRSDLRCFTFALADLGILGVREVCELTPEEILVRAM